MASSLQLGRSGLFLVFWLCELAGVQSFFKGFANMASVSTAAMTSGASGMNDLLLKPNSDLILTMDQSMTPIISTFSAMTFGNRDEHVTAMATAMQSASVASQAPVLATLKAYNVQSESYWLTNQIYVKNANPPLIQALMAIGAVKSIAEEQNFPLIPILNATLGTPPDGILWNVKKIYAHKVWKEGVKGQGVVVAGIDTGVRASHVTLRDNYVGTKNHGWYDPILGTKEPNDVQGHGTHTVGTMVGRNGIGAAPRAKWMACKGCGLHSCLQHALLACGQFVLCPSDPQGKSLNCTNVPHIVNNSWGGPGGQTWYDEVISAWKAAGIIPFFANGNNGPSCETAGSPGDHDFVIAVGATDKDDKLAKFSSRGPKVTMVGGLGGDGGGVIGQIVSMIGKKKQATDCIKPEISAPGHEINSAGFITDNSYKVQSGTSMASPLAAGAAALLLSKNPNLTMEQMKDLMYSTAEQKLPPSGYQQCGDVVETEFPNNMYGHGRLNIYSAYKKMVKMMEAGEKSEEEEDDDKGEEGDEVDDFKVKRSESAE